MNTREPSFVLSLDSHKAGLDWNNLASCSRLQTTSALSILDESRSKSHVIPHQLAPVFKSQKKCYRFKGHLFLLGHWINDLFASNHLKNHHHLESWFPQLSGAFLSHRGVALVTIQKIGESPTIDPKQPSCPSPAVPESQTTQAKSRHLWDPAGPSRAGCHVPIIPYGSQMDFLLACGKMPGKCGGPCWKMWEHVGKNMGKCGIPMSSTRTICGIANC